MSSVEQRIERWRAELSGSETLSTGDINELESHLREEIKHLEEAGLTDVEAFLIARRRMGDTPSLECEFVKVNTRTWPANRIWWMVTGALAYLVADCLGNAASHVTLNAMQLVCGNFRSLSLIEGVVQAITFCAATAFVLLLYIRYSQHPDLRLSTRVRMTLPLVLFVEILMIVAMRICVQYPVLCFKVPGNGQIPVDYSSVSILWKLAAGLFWSCLLIVAMHLADVRKATVR